MTTTPTDLPPTTREPPPIYGLTTRLIEARKTRGLSQRSAARMLTCHRSTLQAFEDGRRMPDLWWAAELSQLYGVTVDWLIFGVTRGALSPTSAPPAAPGSPVPSRAG